MGDTLTVKDVAGELEVEPKTLRKFLRSEVVENGGTIGEDTPGKGRRYSFEPEEAEEIKARFVAWSTPSEESEAEDEESGEIEDLDEDLELEA